ncbi:Transposase family Tnp2 protein [Ceratobasidium sp. AG-Ba]|nr:Transposase family Tnp2 protein [Ceratobasidium sp. AG-Ba]
MSLSIGLPPVPGSPVPDDTPAPGSQSLPTRVTGPGDSAADVELFGQFLLCDQVPEDPPPLWLCGGQDSDDERSDASGDGREDHGNGLNLLLEEPEVDPPEMHLPSADFAAGPDVPGDGNNDSPALDEAPTILNVYLRTWAFSAFSGATQDVIQSVPEPHKATLLAEARQGDFPADYLFQIQDIATTLRSLNGWRTKAHAYKTLTLQFSSAILEATMVIEGLDATSPVALLCEAFTINRKPYRGQYTSPQGFTLCHKNSPENDMQRGMLHAILAGEAPGYGLEPIRLATQPARVNFHSNRRGRLLMIQFCNNQNPFEDGVFMDLGVNQKVESISPLQTRLFRIKTFADMGFVMDRPLTLKATKPVTASLKIESQSSFKGFTSQVSASKFKITSLWL